MGCHTGRAEHGLNDTRHRRSRGALPHAPAATPAYRARKPLRARGPIGHVWWAA